MNNKITDFPIRTEGRETPERILKAALKWEGAEDLVVIANVNDEICVAGTSDMQHELLGLIEMGKYRLLLLTDKD